MIASVLFVLVYNLCNCWNSSTCSDRMLSLKQYTRIYWIQSCSENEMIIVFFLLKSSVFTLTGNRNHHCINTKKKRKSNALYIEKSQFSVTFQYRLFFFLHFYRSNQGQLSINTIENTFFPFKFHLQNLQLFLVVQSIQTFSKTKSDV